MLLHLLAAEKVQEFEKQRRARVKKQQEELDRAKAEHLGRRRLEAEMEKAQRLAELNQKAKRLGVGSSFLGKAERLDRS